MNKMKKSHGGGVGNKRFVPAADILFLIKAHMTEMAA
jgi:hypothetical protein